MIHGYQGCVDREIGTELNKLFDFFQQSMIPHTTSYGGIAQLVERLNGIQEARSSNLLTSTIHNIMGERPDMRREGQEFESPYLHQTSQ